MRRKTRHRLLVLVALAVTGGVALGGAALARSGGVQAAAGQATETADGTVSTASPSAADTEPTRTTAVARTSPVAPPPPTASPSSTVAAGKSVDVVLGYADWDDAGAQVEAAGFVDVVESEGSCTLLLTSGSQQVSVSAAAEPDATTTNCGRLTVPGDRLAAGTWTVTLSYRSERSSGTSQVATVTVPAR